MAEEKNLRKLQVQKTTNKQIQKWLLWLVFEIESSERAWNGVSVKRGIEVYFFFKECCFRVRVKVDTNPNPNLSKLNPTLKWHSL